MVPIYGKWVRFVSEEEEEREQQACSGWWGVLESVSMLGAEEGRGELTSVPA